MGASSGLEAKSSDDQVFPEELLQPGEDAPPPKVRAVTTKKPTATTKKGAAATTKKPTAAVTTKKPTAAVTTKKPTVAATTKKPNGAYGIRKLFFYHTSEFSNFKFTNIFYTIRTYLGQHDDQPLDSLFFLDKTLNFKLQEEVNKSSNCRHESTNYQRTFKLELRIL